MWSWNEVIHERYIDRERQREGDKEREREEDTD